MSFTLSRFAMGAEHRDAFPWAYTSSGRLRRDKGIAKLLDLVTWPPVRVPPSINIIARTFGCLTVVARAPKREGSSSSWWVCVCSCGTAKILHGGDLRRGRIRSCGCLLHKKRAPNGRYGQ